MRRTTIKIYLLLLSATCLGQTSFDHMAMVVKDLEETKKFYVEALGFKNIEDPTGNPLINWLENENGQQIHLIQGNISNISLTKSVHFSFAVVALHPFIQNLRDRNIPFENWPGDKGKITIRQDGVRQIYLLDPNGYWIEINDRKK